MSAPTKEALKLLRELCRTGEIAVAIAEDVSLATGLIDALDSADDERDRLRIDFAGRMLTATTECDALRDRIQSAEAENSRLRDELKTAAARAAELYHFAEYVNSRVPTIAQMDARDQELISEGPVEIGQRIVRERGTFRELARQLAEAMKSSPFNRGCTSIGSGSDIDCKGWQITKPDWQLCRWCVYKKKVDDLLAQCRAAGLLDSAGDGGGR